MEPGRTRPSGIRGIEGTVSQDSGGMILKREIGLG